jgi:hypothetical protein
MKPFPHHNQLIQRILKLIQPDLRYLGLLAGGSWSDQRLDQWSDLDLILLCEPEHTAELLFERKKLAAQMGDLLVSFSGEHVQEPRLLICLFANPLLHVGLKLVSLAEYTQRVEDPEILWARNSSVAEFFEQTKSGVYPPPDLAWIEERFWVWIHYGALKLGRGELVELADHLSYLRNYVLGPLLLMQHGHQPRRVRRVEMDLPPEAFDRLRQTIANYDRQALGEALFKTIEIYRDLREYHALPLALWQNKAEKAVITFLQTVLENRPVL